MEMLKSYFTFCLNERLFKNRYDEKLSERFRLFIILIISPIIIFIMTVSLIVHQGLSTVDMFTLLAFGQYLMTEIIVSRFILENELVGFMNIFVMAILQFILIFVSLVMPYSGRSF